MIPLTLATEIRSTLLDYLTTTFNFQDEAVETALVDFLQDPHKGLFKGPYVNLRLPFRKIGAEHVSPLQIAPAFTPYIHQHRAFQRLTAQEDHTPQPTLITTGTGSGKTECFLFPILDYCYAHRGEPGIKAIILYPMNALASDQAARLARQLGNDPRLNGQVIAGMYIGGGQDEKRHTTMGTDHLIDDRDTLRKHPPDILLTNYKMLDFLLLRPDDKTLWAENTPETLRFLVLDELHTYDGAQGSDVACLIRRLTARLNTPPGYLCPVGTSATVASDDGQTLGQLTAFAHQIFGLPFEPDSVIGEDRLTLGEFLPVAPALNALPADRSLVAEQTGEPYQSYIERQGKAWFGRVVDEVALGEALKAHTFLSAVLAGARGEIVAWDDLVERVARQDPAFAAGDVETRTALLRSFLALIAHARRREEGRVEPFLVCQAQLWVRELSRLMRQVSAEPQFFWRDDVPPGVEPRGLPAYYCRECGHSGWLTILHDGDDQISDDHRKIYKYYFDNHRYIHYVYPGHRADQLPGVRDRLCPQCLYLSQAEHCPLCQAETLAVVIHHEVSSPGGNAVSRDRQQCPSCGTDGALSLVGSQAASLSSVAISYLYTSPLNREKKLLAFTDSVQDASHRAAFFGARTYRFSLRTAFQAALADDASIPLNEFTDRVLEHWRREWAAHSNVEQRLAATFIPPDLRDLDIYQEYMLSQPAPMPPALLGDLRQRLSWEVAMEYGFTARLGRSLEKVCSSTAYVAPDLLDRAAQKLALLLAEEIGTLHEIPVSPVRHFLRGLLERTRLRGGVAHPMLKRYAEEQGNWYMLTRAMQPLLSPFHKHSPRLPKFLTDAYERDVFDPFIASGASRRTWYSDWAQRALSPALGVADLNEVYRIAVRVLTDEGLLHRYSKGTANAYGLRPEALRLTRRAVAVSCDTCGHHQTSAEDAVGEWVGQPCLNYQCGGHYVVQSRLSQRYYRALYQRGQVERIYAHEHTGLLSRGVREEVEEQFKEQTRADAINLLAATSTLEMGIDIGDLSVTMACSVPPATTNYLQRIGRAGRATGNSLILTLANAQPHDLYFFEEPLEMMAGSIAPPGCFLDAPDMLKRQFLAFGLDTWTATDPKAGLLPRNVQKMLAGYKKGGFPENFLAFYARQSASLLERFLALFGAFVSPENADVLRQSVISGDLPARIRQALAETEAERDELRNARRAFKERRDKIEADPAQHEKPEEELKRLEGEMKLLLRLVQEIEDKYVLNFFTDAGLLPNYAFPESGVKLKAVISGFDSPRPDGNIYEVREYERAASLALRELAPFNHFYAEGRKLRIDHLEWAGQEGAVEQWQFCDRCSHMELVQASNYRATCPACGSPQWSDRGQQHDMTRFRAASAWVNHHDSLVGDDSEERERTTYQIGRYFEIPPERLTPAYVIPGLPFGFEHLNPVTLRELNFGPTDMVGQKINIADEERPLDGFFVCPDCGLVTGSAHNPNATASRHTRSCQYRAANRQPAPHNIYLYREMTSEALRILLPVSTIFIEEKMATFEACLDLGLRRWFQGNPGHLQIMSHTEPTADGARRRFLVLYDTVPGGTSFLKDLARPETFFAVLQLAHDTLSSCRCRLEPGKQACYRCLYSYRAQRDLSLISRRLGVQMLGEILAARDTLEPVPSLSNIHLDSLIESELEQRFIDALEAHAKKTPGNRWSVTLHNGKRAHELTIGERRWIIEPQVPLGESQSVTVASRADFVIWPQTTEGLRALPVAVFTDGFAYHVRPNEPSGSLGDDLLKRRAIANSGKFWVWSITWDDVKEFEENSPFNLNFFAHDYQRFDQAIRDTRSSLSARLLRENAMAQLIEYLQYPDRSIWQETVFRLAVAAMLPMRPAVSREAIEALESSLQIETALPDLTIPADVNAGDQCYAIIQRRHNHLLLHVPQSKLRIPNALSATLRLDDTHDYRAAEEFKTDWRQFLLLANIFQFLPSFNMLSTEYARLYSSQPSEPPPTATVHTPEWETAFRFAAPACLSLLQACVSVNLPAPIVGYELVDETGHVTASAELAWEDRRLAVLLPHEQDGHDKFVSAGWSVFAPEDIENIRATLTG